jgi:hypothetical protein
MDDRRFLKPASEGLMVLNPVTRQYLPAEGAEVPIDAYWTRRLLDGDVVEIVASQPATPEVLQDKAAVKDRVDGEA